MKAELRSSKLRLKKSPIQGYGVFADQDIAPNEIIEESYVLTTEGRDHYLANYIFDCGEKNLLALGYGSIYNHSKRPNADYNCDPSLSLITFRANRFIKCGEEIFIHYGNEWFSSRQARIKNYSLWTATKPYLGMFLRFTLVFTAMWVMKLMLTR